ncbi:MAG: ABC transporter substrate-binding protein [Anaerolineae bacterium]|nr:ABC transporter substrate-binding protein [Anaerolineae bacterium]
MKRLLPILIALSALIAGCCDPIPPPIPTSTPRPFPSSAFTPTPTRIVYGLTLSPTGIDPHVNASSELGIPLTSVYDTLVYLDPEMEDFVPGLAEDWDISEDGLSYTFYLREGVTFHDGTPFNAEAVRFNLERITSPDLLSQKARFMLGPYKQTEVIDEYTVRIHLSEPFAPLLDSLSQVYLGMASPTAVEKWGREYQLHQVGTGPFIFAEYVPDDHLLLRRNPDYAWGPSIYQHETALADEIEFRFFVDSATRSPTLETGEVDVMGEIPPQDAARLMGSKDLYIEAVPIPGVSLMFFLNTTRPPLEDVQVRQALLYGTDRQAIVSTIFRDTSPVAYGPLAAKTFGYEPAVQDYYAYDPVQAAGLLDDAGWIDTDDDGIRDKDGVPLTLDMVLMGWGYMPEIGQLVAAQWSELGIGVNSQLVSYPEALAIADEGTYHLIPFNLSGSDPDILRKFFHSQASFNWSKLDDAEMDAWLEAAARTTDWEEREALYSQIQLRIMKQGFVIPIRDYVNLNGVSSRVQGLRFDAQGWFPWLIDVTVSEIQ